MELALDARAPPLQVARGLVVVVLGVRERSLANGELLGSFLLLAQVPDAVGRAGGPRALAPERRLGAEAAVVALHEPRRPQLAEGEAPRGMAQGSPLRR